MLRLSASSLLSALALFQTAHALNACPSGETIYTGNGGIRYRVCPGTDLIGESLSVTNNVASVTACAQICDQNMNCFKAVYDKQNRVCHMKGYGNLNWQPNGQFDTVQAEQVNIAKCPYGETTYTNNGVSHRFQQQKCRLLTHAVEDLQDLS
jgi:galactose oxidase